ncbi:MAG: phosphoribosylamine--glycine ligase, partial [Oscillospiraceae bacterium]|nr:phosphoribosylamine--glycine ligase [Oscillospiraceae bacterium]
MLKSKRILIIGSGGREHSIGCKLSQNQETLLFFAPGNGGTAQIGENININVDNIKELTVFAKDNKIDLTIVGPELPLTLGIVDEFRKEGLRIFGP